MRRNLSIYACELAGTAFMLFWGVSAVALMWGSGSPPPIVPVPALRPLITGLLFAGGATAVVYSPFGKRSGAHINPAVTLAFWRLGKIPTRDAPRSATAAAVTDAQLRRVTRDSFGRLLAADPVRTQELLRQLARRVREASGGLAAGVAEGR
jgi:hypothetical protein